MHGGESNPSAFELGLGVEALERSEELLSVLHVEARPIVAHEKERLLCFLGLRFEPFVDLPRFCWAKLRPFHSFVAAAFSQFTITFRVGSAVLAKALTKNLCPSGAGL